MRNKFIAVLLLLNLIAVQTYADSGHQKFLLEDKLASFRKNVPKKGLKVVWWNIDCGLETTPEKIQNNLKTTNLESNIIALASSEYKPDVLILGEYCPYSTSKKDQEVIINSFKYSHHIERNIPKFTTSNGRVNQKNGFLVLSDYPMEQVMNERLWSKKDRSASQDDRRYLLFSIVKEEKTYFINPVHLVNPWREIYNNKGKFKVFSEVTMGNSNANALQVDQLIYNFNRYVPVDSSFLMVGDFNSPGSLMGFEGYGYKRLRQSFLVSSMSHQPTFKGDGPFPPCDLDHAFGQNLRFAYSEVWPLQGSRHLPLYVVIE